MFKASLKPPPKGMFTEFPHQNHASIDSLFNRCKELYEEDPRKAPTIIFIKAGEHEVEGYVEDEEEEDEDEFEPYLLITYAMKIIGAGQGKTFIRNGGFRIEGTKEVGKNVVLKDMTISETSEHGVYGYKGLSWLCDSLTITQCGQFGVQAYKSKGRLINCVTIQCGWSGIYCGLNALIELEGDQTKVDGNVTDGHPYCYGLYTFSTSSRIHLLFPLTKESVSTNHLCGGNYNSRGTIQTVDSFETSLNKK